MAKFCDVCGKGKISGHSITHSDRKIKRTWKPNVRKITIIVDGIAQKKSVCTRCMRTGKIERVI